MVRHRGGRHDFWKALDAVDRRSNASSGQLLFNALTRQEVLVRHLSGNPTYQDLRRRSCVSLCRPLIRGYSCREADLANPDELVLFMTLPVGVDELIIPGVLASRDIPVHLTERYFARQGRYVGIRVPASRLQDARRALDDAKRVGENLDSGTEV